jgi:dihydrofolate reductase
MTISLIASVDQHMGIGYKNDLLFKLPNDMKYFKELTMGKSILMGRQTFNSIGHPLAGRENVVVTNDTNHFIEGCVMLNELTHPGWFKMWQMSKQELFVIGGESIFKQFIPYANKIYLTVVNGDFIADRYFPRITNEWEITSTKFVYPDKNNKYKQAYVVLDKR